MTKTKQIDPIPDEFKSYEEAGEFWDKHDITDYLGLFRAVEPDSRSRHPRKRAKKDTTALVALRGTRVKRGK